ncbi:CheR family methyltransferase [Aliikangiella maris]|uniref:protein-glutamate O-methyltransferase n=2 Tax=Aliikangiella maris TaxID=3162458 RepID=A0ABV3MT58_9GAMM
MSVFNAPEMESEEFELWQAYLEKQTGLWLPESRKPFLIRALSGYMLSKGISNYRELYFKLNAGAVSVGDWASLVDSLTVNETCFYREKHSLGLVSSYCRNMAIERFQAAPDKPQHLQLWSVGCSTGEEVYTLAIEMDKLNLGLHDSVGKEVYFGVTGIDISYPSLAVAREGVYAARQLDFVPMVTKNLYFNRLADGYFQIRDNIRQRCCFIQSNILEMKAKLKQNYDVIYCQNVLIYFKQDRKQSVIDELVERLKPGGLLVLGHGEITGTNNDLLTKVDNKHCLAYLRKDK